MVIDLYDETSWNGYAPEDITVVFNGTPLTNCIRVDTERGMVWLNPNYSNDLNGPLKGKVEIRYAKEV